MLSYRRGMKPVVQKLRRNMTDAERLLWSKLRRQQMAGASFYRQRIIGQNIVDFYCRKAAPIIEVDGGQHFHGDGKEKDVTRDFYFQERGSRVIRFGNHEVLKNIDAVLGKIRGMVIDG